MPRQENAREDLWAEATALVQRAELSITGSEEPIVVGFRRGGAASVYFGQDEAHHFDSAARMRRAYRDGLLFKADRGRLASLERRRSEGQVQLVRHDLSEAETAAFLGRAERRLRELKAAMAAGSVRWLREVPQGGGVREQIGAWLAGLPERIEVARSPRVG